MSGRLLSVARYDLLNFMSGVSNPKVVVSDSL